MNPVGMAIIWVTKGGPKEVAMSERDKLSNKAQDLKGNIKEKVGDATDNRDLEAKGQSDQTKANLKQAGEKVKDAFKS
jgi:uncharacterized protein YjbJ (UPF0337 family)